MTRLDFIKKWLLYGIALVPVWFLETLVLRRLPVWGVFPVLLPLAAAAVAALEGAVAGAGFGLAVGILCDAVYYGQAGGMTAGLALAGAAVGLVSQYGLRQNYWGFLLCSGGVLAALNLFRVLSRLLDGTASLLPLLKVAVPETLWSLVFTPVVYLIFRRVHRRVRRTSL
jgi:cell shape-determining protein MreD